METHDQLLLHETNKYIDSAFPIGIYIVTKDGIVPDGRGYQDLHWHEELQFTYVFSGTMNMRVNNSDYVLQKGQAIFINKNLLHITTALTEDGRYVSLNFPDRLLGFFPGSRMEQRDVLPFTNNYAFPAVIFNQETLWHETILVKLVETIALLQAGKQAGQEYVIAMNLTFMWHQLIEHMRDSIKLPSKSYVRKQERMYQMLSYIQNHHANTIHLADLAAVAHISVGECCRCFQSMIGKTPNQYILEYRVFRSMELLDMTEMSVSEISFAVGFNDASYYIHYFKKLEGMTPKEYRNRKC